MRAIKINLTCIFNLIVRKGESNHKSGFGVNMLNIVGSWTRWEENDPEETIDLEYRLGIKNSLGVVKTKIRAVGHLVCCEAGRNFEKN